MCVSVSALESGKIPSSNDDCRYENKIAMEATLNEALSRIFETETPMWMHPQLRRAQTTVADLHGTMPAL